MSTIKPTYQIKAAFAALIFVLCFLAGCSPNRFQKIAVPEKFKIIYNVPFVSEDGMVEIAYDSFFISYLDKTVLYQLPYYFVLENDTGIISIEIKYNYFVHNKGESEGNFYDSINAKFSKRVSLDSLSKRKWLHEAQLYDQNSDTLIAQRREKTNYSLVETYVSKIKNDPTYPDTSVFYYTSKIKNIDFSFSRKLDSLKRLKVCKVILIHKSQVYPGYTFQAPRREFRFELKEVPSGDSRVLLDLFNRFKKEWIQ